MGRHLVQARTLARDSLDRGSPLGQALRPEQLEDATLAEALGELACGWSEQSGVAAELETTGDAAAAAAGDRGHAVPGRRRRR